MVDVLDGFAVLLIGLAVVNIASTSVLVWAAWRHRWPALEERATVAVILAFSATIGAMLGLARLQLLAISGDAVLLLLVAALVAVSMPSILWLVAYLSGRFDEA